MTEYEINGRDYTVDYDLDNRIIKVDVDNNDVEKHRRLVGVLDRSEATCPEGVSSREAVANQYRYDALGRRVIRKEGTTKSALIWWGNSECAEHKHTAAKTVIQNDIMSHPSRLNSVIARAVDGSKTKLQWYHKNYLDHVYAVSDDDGDLIEHYRYTAFGEVTIYNELGNQVANTQINNQILWNTRRRDEVTGYYMYKFRHYSAELGRWLARDPIGEGWETGEMNLYAFVGNDVVNWRDELGNKRHRPYNPGNRGTRSREQANAEANFRALRDLYRWLRGDRPPRTVRPTPMPVTPGRPDYTRIPYVPRPQPFDYIPTPSNLDPSPPILEPDFSPDRLEPIPDPNPYPVAPRPRRNDGKIRCWFIAHQWQGGSVALGANCGKCLYECEDGDQIDDFDVKYREKKDCPLNFTSENGWKIEKTLLEAALF